MDKPNSKLIMTLREWIEYEMPYNEYFFNCSGCGHLDMSDYKWPRFGNPLINEPIGVSIGVTLPMLYTMNKHMKNQENVNTKLVYANFKTSNDKNRRGKMEKNREIIASTLKKNDIKNSKPIAPLDFLKMIAQHKFTISPEGNGIDTHRHYESLYFKSVPIIERNDKILFKYENLPVLYTDDYSEINEEYLNKKWDEMLETEYDFNRLFVSSYNRDIINNKIVQRSNHYGNKYQKKPWYPIELNCLDKKLENIYNDLTLITLTTNGYKHFTLNALESMHRMNVKLNTKVYALDDLCKDDFKKYTDNFVSLNVDFSGMASYKDKNWSLVTLNKLKAIYDELHLSKYVLFFDGDIAFENIFFLTDTYEKITAEENKDVDMFCQIEYYIHQKDYCTGFMIIKSSEKTKNFFNPQSYLNNGKYNNDQDYVNSNKNGINIKRLPIENYPNGKWHKEKKPKFPYMIHFNFAKGNDKMERMKKSKKWYT